MIIYIDIVFLINLIFDLLLLLTVNIALKRYSKILKLFLSALFGSCSLIALFIPFGSFGLFILKGGMAIIMNLIAFGYKNIRYTFYNIMYFFMCSIILGGFLYYLKLEFSNNREGFVFYYNGLAFNYVFLILVAPLILYVFLKSIRVLKEVKNYYYKVKIVLDDTTILVTGFLDTGNKLRDPVTNKAIILLNKKIIKGKYNIRSPMYVPFNSLNNHGLLECVKPKKLWINDILVKDYLIGFSDNSFKLNGIDCLLNYKLLEDI